MNKIFIKFDKKLKLIIVGDADVGKTTLFYKLRDEPYSHPTTTIGVDFMSMYRKYKEKKYKICIWDTAGQEKFQSIVTTYFREACGIILMFDLSRYDTYINIQNWLNLLSHSNKCKHEHPILLIGNKSDLKNIIPNQELEKFINSPNVIYKEISCLNADKQSLEILIDLLIEKILEIKDKCKGVIRYSDEKVKIKTKEISKQNITCC